ncbi:MAG: hypothetical protein KGM42_06180 [Hyphomicrobiales bacterium]|nr:hypothetical protein [Hyphomicrobiales bacterium]
MRRRKTMKIAKGLALAASIAATMAAPAMAMPAMAMPMARSVVAPEAQAKAQEVAYRRHVVRRAHRPVYRRHYGYNPGPALFGAMAGMIGAGIAASQEPYYGYGYGYGYPAYPYYGYGYPYW